MGQKQILDFLRNNYKYIRSNYHITKIGLIGSYARNENTDKSDIDLLIEFEPGVQNIYDIK